MRNTPPSPSEQLVTLANELNSGQGIPFAEREDIVRRLLTVADAVGAGSERISRNISDAAEEVRGGYGTALAERQDLARWLVTVSRSLRQRQAPDVATASLG